MENTCIVIIDPQKDFTDPSHDYARRHGTITQIREAKQHIQQLLHSPVSEPIIIVRSDYRPEQFGTGMFLCIPGTTGHDIDLNIPSTCTVITKTAHSCFSSPAFIRYLEIHHITSLVLCGFLAEYCVRQTAIDALSGAYQVTLLQDFIGTGDDVQERKAAMLTALQEKGAVIKQGYP